MANLLESLRQVLIEAKIEDVLAKYPHIDSNTKQSYVDKIPNSRHLDWALKHHDSILPHHDIPELLKSFERNKSKLSKKQIEQYKSVDELHQTVLPYIGQGLSAKEKGNRDTTILYSSPTMTIRQHHTPESCRVAGGLPKNNRSGKDRAAWCISADNDSQQGYIDKYTHQGLHPIYSIEHHHSDGTSSRHMMVADTMLPSIFHNDYYFGTSHSVQLKDESNSFPSESLDDYCKKYPELHNTPIIDRFTKEGRDKIINDIIDCPNTKAIHVSYIAEHGNSTKKGELIEKSLRHPNLDSIGLSHIIHYAHRTNNHLLMDKALNHPNLGGDGIEYALHYLRSNDYASHKHIIDKIINHPSLNETSLEKMANYAVQTKNKDLVDTIVNHRKFKNINGDALPSIAKHSLDTGNNHLFDVILNHKNLKPHNLDSIAFDTMDTKNNHLISKIIDHPAVNSGTLETINDYAVDNKNNKLLHRLLNNPKLNQYSLRKTIMYGINTKDDSIVQKALNHPKLDDSILNMITKHTKNI